MAIGGIILFISLIVLVYNIITMLRAPKGYTEYPIAEVAETADKTPKLLERWGVWVTVAVLLVLTAYGMPVMEILNNPALVHLDISCGNQTRGIRFANTPVLHFHI